MRASRLALFAALLLAGCDVFESGSPIPFRVVADTTIVLPDTLDSRIGVHALLRTQQEADALRATYGLGVSTVPDVDWSRESVFVIANRLNNNRRLVVTRVAIYGTDRVEYTYEQRLVAAPATGLHTVLVAVATERISEDYGVAVVGNGLQSGR